VRFRQISGIGWCLGVPDLLRSHEGVFWFLLVTVACAVALYWFGFSDKPPRPDAARQSPVVAGQSADMKEEVPDPEPAPAAPKPPVSFPPKTGPLFLETEGGCDGSETLFG